MEHFNAAVKFLHEFEYAALRIPDYQRPYVWTIKETRQLWDDVILSKSHGKKEYRIGTIILHQNTGDQTLDIVDGQQRLTTLSLLMHLLRPHDLNLLCSPYLDRPQFMHKDSRDNIYNNASYLDQWIKDELNDKHALFNYLLQRCSMVQLKVTDISEAFQMFDSQNGRGLPLEPYNLLKAYHLRYMDGALEELKINLDKAWEKAAKNEYKKDYLKQVISEQLYRTRMWSKHYSAYSFSKNELGEFKGAAPGHVRYPYQNFVNYVQSNSIGGDVYRYEAEKAQAANTQINQLMINGVPFFNYIDNYIVMYRFLFESKTNGAGQESLKKFYQFFDSYCKGFRKKGDYYLLEVYKSIIMLVYDKFGISGLMAYYQLLYARIFRFRLEKKFVKYDSVAQQFSYTFSRIHHAKELVDLNFLKAEALADIVRQETNFNNDIVDLFFQNHFSVKIS